MADSGRPRRRLLQGGLVLAGALTSGDEAAAAEKTTELLEAVHRFARVR